MDGKDKRKFINRFKLGKHHTIERFGLLFASLSIGLVATAGGGIYNKIQEDRGTLSDKALYTAEFTSSKTQAAGRLESVHISEDRKRAFVLLKLENISNLSTQADDYQLFVTAAQAPGNSKTLIGKPAMSVYMFGSTGYMGIYMVNEQGFQTQVLDMIVRANAEIVPSTASVEEQTGDVSFQKYDQFRIQFNPGAGEAKISKTLNSGDVDATRLYEELIVEAREAVIKQGLQAIVDEMRVKTSAIVEYTKRVAMINIDGNKVVVPDPVKDVAGDKFVKKNDKFYYEPKYVYPKGYNFNWLDGSIKNGYSKDVVEAGASLTDTIKKRASRAEDESVEKELKEKSTYMMADGKTFNEAVNGTVQSDITRDAQTNIANLQNAWSEYRSLKREYQEQGLLELLMLELTLENVRTSYTVNTSKDVVRYY